MLWSKDCDNVFVDLLLESKEIALSSSKNNAVSLNTRTAGNSKLMHNDFNGAMKLYNKSIRFAQDNDHLCLAFANRSYCFLRLNSFDRCLIDVENAINACYPENLLPKLEKRRKICLENLKTQQIFFCDQPKLSFPAQHNLPCIASVLKINNNEQFGRHIIAECNIRIGETLLVEEAYVRVTTTDECYNCGKKMMNFLPCTNCADVMFCSDDCVKNNFHSVECTIVFNSDDIHGIKSSNFVLRSLMIGISAFGSVSEMMEFVQNCLRSDVHEMYQSVDTPKAKYQTFFKLSTSTFIERVRDQASSIFHVMMRSKELATKFDTVHKQRFLVHLACHHALIMLSNAFGGLCNPPDEVLGTQNHSAEMENEYERSIFLTASYFNHSCLPNVTKLAKGNLAVVKAIQPIKKGQQLFVTYLAGDLIERTSKDRNDELQSTYKFRCKCELCIVGVKHSALVLLEADKDFQFVVQNIKNYQMFLRQIKECCIKFMLKYSENVASEPGYYILSTLTAMLQKELEQ